jgi:hypothetical protein
MARSNGKYQTDHLSPEEWCERFEAWAADHRQLLHEANDSRDAIYAGRGE